MNSLDAPLRLFCSARIAFLCYATLLSSGMVSPVHAEEPGELAHLGGGELFKQHCARCHGVMGEGTDQHYAQPLAGDLAPAELASFLVQAMPPDMPGTLSHQEAEQVAKFVHAEFYSEEAQRRRPRPARQSARLTGRQYACVLADLMVSFYEPASAGTRGGLTGDYAAIDADGNGKQIFTRVDPEVRFDFGTSSPDPERIAPSEFAISWTGSVRVPATGQYEFIVRSPNSFRLYINSKSGPPLVDGWIQSGDQTEHRGSVKLVGGRSYPLQLHFTKAGQGVKKTEALRARIAPAAISLSWVPPGRGEETIPARWLSPVVARETLVVQTPFPPDDSSTGFERGTSVSAEWDQAATQAAIECAEYVLPRLGDLCGVATPDAQHVSQLRDFCARLAERAFRSPLTPEQRAIYVDRPFESTADPAVAVQRSVLMVLKSPRFLYVDLDGIRPEAYTVASRLSLAMWDSLPDDTLLAAAASGQLSSREQIAAHAHRMAGDPRSTAKLREFFLHWLKADRLHELRKDPQIVPQFNAAVAADLRTSFELHIEDALADERCDLRSLLLAEHLHLNKRLAPLYGVHVQSDALFEKVTLPDRERAGVLTHPYLMAVLADSSASSPIRRGVFVARSLLGRVLRPPPDAVTPLVASLHPDLTTRQRVTLQTESASCQNCHALINPLGFTLENFDTLGRTQTDDNGRPIDSSGHYRNRSGETIQFAGARALAEFLAHSDEVHTAFIEKLFYYTTKYPARALGPETLPQLKQEFVTHHCNVRHLMAEIATATAIAVAGGSPSPDH